jgi:hypothetical protein
MLRVRRALSKGARKILPLPGYMTICPINWHDEVQVLLSELPLTLQNPTEPGRVLWDGISLAEAVRRWLNLSIDAQPLVTIFGTDTFSGAQIAQLAMRADFPPPPADTE